MAQDKLVVCVDHFNTGVLMNWMHVDLNKDDLTEKVAEIAVGVWGWTDEDIEVNGDKLQAFLIDPELWQTIGHRINWPQADAMENQAVEQAVTEAITRCKISVYKTMKMHWTNERATAYASRSEDHRTEILAMTGGSRT